MRPSTIADRRDWGLVRHTGRPPAVANRALESGARLPGINSRLPRRPKPLVLFLSNAGVLHQATPLHPPLESSNRVVNIIKRVVDSLGRGIGST